jgi:hypothetical protein
MANFKIGGFDASPTKGWRGFSRPRKANSRQRRRLIYCGATMQPLSREGRLLDLGWDPKLSNNRRTRDRYLKLKTEVVS